MKNILVLSILFLTLFSCKFNQNKENNQLPDDIKEVISPIVTTPTTILPAFEIELPAGYSIIGESSGDLNKDKIAEKVVVINTDRNTDLGTKREIHIYKIANNEWELWHRSIGAVLPSEHGGMMGEPFVDVKIENGTVTFEHFGGSRQKWKTIHRFRFQNNDWFLIGTTMENASLCEEVETFDYNLSTGQVVYQRAFETCDHTEERKTTKVDKENFVYKLNSLPKMAGFSFEGLYAIHPLSGKCVPINACYDYDNRKSEGE